MTVAGLGGARYSSRSLHTLARRWVVFVPAGLVLHDPLVLADAILLPRRQIVALGPAQADTRATDLTQGAPGLALEAQLAEAVELGLRAGRHRAAEAVSTDRVLFRPLRPGALLDAAANGAWPSADPPGPPPPGAPPNGRRQRAVPPPSTSSPS